MDTLSAKTPLYRRLLGDAWRRLRAPVRRAHCRGEPLRAHGVFAIRRGRGPLARWVGRVAALPPACGAVETRLLIRQVGGGEHWRRTFGRHVIETHQHATPDGLLEEYFGVIAMRFRLRPIDGGLTFEQVAAALRLGPLRLALPRWLAPRVAAREEAAAEPGRTSVRVEIVLPLAGPVLAYEGWLEPVEDEPC